MFLNFSCSQTHISRNKWIPHFSKRIPLDSLAFVTVSVDIRNECLTFVNVHILEIPSIPLKVTRKEDRSALSPCDNVKFEAFRLKVFRTRDKRSFRIQIQIMPISSWLNSIWPKNEGQNYFNLLIQVQCHPCQIWDVPTHIFTWKCEAMKFVRIFNYKWGDGILWSRLPWFFTWISEVKDFLSHL